VHVLFVLFGSLLFFRVLGFAGIGLFTTWAQSARVALATMFLFTAVSHFAPMKTDLIAMVPPGLPRPDLLVFGARVIATTSSEEKARRLEAAGADEVVNYHAIPDWHIAIRELTNGRGVDQVVDIGGGTLERSILSVALDGQVNFIGPDATSEPGKLRNSEALTGVRPCRAQEAPLAT
jgi:Zinc-binding dehydrogenase